MQTVTRSYPMYLFDMNDVKLAFPEGANPFEGEGAAVLRDFEDWVASRNGHITSMARFGTIIFHDEKAAFEFKLRWC